MTALRLLTAAVLALAAALWWRWDKAPLQWSPPAAIVPDVSIFQVPNTQTIARAQSASSYLAVLDRPIFSPDRRPPTALDEKSPAVEIDVFSNLQLLGLLTGKEFTGALVRENGKVRRIKVLDELGGWQLQSVDGRDATFARSGETKVLKLVPTKALAPVPTLAQSTPAGMPVPQSAAVPSQEDLAALENQKREEAKRENIRKRNILRASAGLPPVND